ncbi:MAG: alpha/beta hydrolase [Clostridiaceae bacterium]|nr:alpha/beta hydrolase [Clostridiaceae bacterium]
MWILYVLLGLIAIYLGFVFYISNQLYRLALSRKFVVDMSRQNIVSTEQVDLLEWFYSGKEIFQALPYENWEMTKDNLNLKAVYLAADASRPATEFNGLVAVLVHGWRDTKEARMRRGLQYHEAGFDVLIPDLRSHGESEGTQIDMGCVHRDDIIQWLQVLREQMSERGLAQPRGFILDGLSMGSATVLTLSGDKLPDDVLAIIADCGYSSMFEQGAWLLRKMNPLIRYPVLLLCFLQALLFAGVNFLKGTAYEQIQKAEIPVFIIHGTADSFVPYYMGEKLFAACSSSRKEFWAAEGAEHGVVACMYPDEYNRRCLDFIRSVLK